MTFTAEQLKKIRELNVGIIAKHVAAERRRIRNKQSGALAQLCRVFDQTSNVMLHDLLLAIHVQLDSATRTSRKKGKR